MPWHLLILALVTTAPVAAAPCQSFKQMKLEAARRQKARKSKAALPRLRKLVELKPGDAESHAALGWALFEIGKRDAGMNEELKAIKLNPRCANAHHHLASMYFLQNKLKQAADEFRITLKLDAKKECNCGPVRSLLLAYPQHRQ